MKQLLSLLSLMLLVAVGTPSYAQGDKPSSDEIWYTTTDGNIVYPNSEAFGSKIISNTYRNGKGVIIVEGDCIVEIGKKAFDRCRNLKSIAIPDSVTSIGSSAFFGCFSLTSIAIPDSVTSIGSSAFFGCFSLTSITIPDSVTSIGRWAFYGCDSLTSVTIPDSVTSIGERAFSGCFSLTSITIPGSVTSIGEYAFSGCPSLTSITIPDSVTSIGDEAFVNCTSLTNFYGKFASEDGRCLIVDGELVAFAPFGLTQYSIPDSVTEIGNRAFYGCTSLTNFYGKFASEDGRCLIVDGELVAFAPFGLTQYSIPDSVTSIGEDAFYGCTSLTRVTIGNGVTSIGWSAFWGCESLIKVYCKPTTPPSGGYNMFDDNASGRKIYVPRGSVNAYKNAKNWSDYADAIVGYDF